MDNLPVHMRISTLTPSNEEVNASRATIAKLSSNWGKITDLGAILAKAGMVADALSGNGRPHHDLGTEVQAALQEHASAYLYEERPFDVGICAGMAVLSILRSTPSTHGWTTSDVFLTAMWAALVPTAARRRQAREAA